MIAGIDPGLSGCLCLLAEDGTDAVFIDLPVVAKVQGKGNELNARGFANELRGYAGAISACYVEAVHAMPAQGVTSVWSFAETVGVIKGVIATLAIPAYYVTPQRWKKHAGLIGTEKDVSRTVAIQLYPHLADQLARKKDIGRADALLIAHYGKWRLTDDKKHSTAA